MAERPKRLLAAFTSFALNSIKLATIVAAILQTCRAQATNAMASALRGAHLPLLTLSDGPH
ncbi:hypothetical protein [Sphingobium sp. MK2]|uniref:hypothetical protein n=1 Tax=Sphingobium sp. MK2 TaxID=3116540 RepID=UPI0032E35AF3